MGSLRGFLASQARTTDRFIRRGLLFLAVYLLSIAFLAGGVCLLLSGFYLWLLARLGNPAALLATACVLLLLAVVLMSVWLFVGRPTEPPTAAGEGLSTDDLKALDNDLDRVVRDLNRVLSREAPSLAVSALVLGVAIGASPKLRRGILRWFW